MKMFKSFAYFTIAISIFFFFPGADVLAQDENQVEEQPSAQSIIDKGQKLLKKDKAEAAYRVFLSGLKEYYPDNPELLSGAGVSSYLAGYASNSLEYLFKAVDLLPESYDVNLYLGKAMFEQGQQTASDLMTQNEGYMMMEDALSFMQKAMEVNKTASAPCFDLAVAFKFLGDLDKANNAVDEALKRSPDSVEAMLMKGDIAYGEYQNAGASGNSAEVAEKIWNRAMDLYYKAKNADKNNAASWVGIATLFECEKNWDKAVEAYTESLKLNPDILNSYNRIIAIYAAKENQKKNSEENKEDPEANEKSDEVEDEKTLTDALKSVLDAIKKRYPNEKSKRATPYYYLGYAQFKEYDYEKSYKSYLWAGKYNSQYKTSATYFMIKASLGLGQTDKATKSFLETTASDPEGLAYFMKNDSDFISKVLPGLSNIAYKLVNNLRVDDARKVNHQILKVIDNNHSLYNNYAFLCRETRRYEESYKAYEKALELNPTNPSYLNDAALILHYHLHRDLDKAAEMYSLAIVEAKKIINDKQPNTFELQEAKVALRDATNNLRLLKAGINKERDS